MHRAAEIPSKHRHKNWRSGPGSWRGPKSQSSRACLDPRVMSRNSQHAGPSVLKAGWSLGKPGRAGCLSRAQRAWPCMGTACLQGVCQHLLLAMTQHFRWWINHHLFPNHKPQVCPDPSGPRGRTGGTGTHSPRGPSPRRPEGPTHSSPCPAGPGPGGCRGTQLQEYVGEVPATLPAGQPREQPHGPQELVLGQPAGTRVQAQGPEVGQHYCLVPPLAQVPSRP